MKARWIPCVLTLLATALPAQNKPDLDKLLKELGTVGSAEWQKRFQSLEQAISRHAAQAKRLRKQAADAEKQAKAEDAKAAAARAQLQRLRQLQRLVPTAKKPVPRKAAPKKPAPKRATPKKPAPKKPVAKPVGKKSAPVANALTALTFEDHMSPIFEEHCVVCHDSQDRSGGLDLSSYVGLARGGSSGRTLVPGEPDRSRLWQLISHQEKPTMPPDSDRLSAALLAQVRRWIEIGAPRNSAAASALSAAAAAKAKTAKAKTAKAKTARRPIARTLKLSLPLAGKLTAVTPTPAAPLALKCLAHSPGCDLLALPGFGQVLLLQASTHKKLGALPFGDGQVEALAFSANGSHLLATGGVPGKTGRAVLYDMITYKKVREFGRFFDAILAGALHIDPKSGTGHVALGGPDRKATVFALDGRRLFVADGHQDWVLGVAFSRDGRRLASADRGGRILVSEVPRGRNLNDLRGHVGAVHAVAYHPNGTLLSAGADGSLRGWRTDGRPAFRRNNGGTARLLSLSVSAPGSILSGGGDNQIRMFRANGAPLPRLVACQDWAYGVCFSPKANRIWAGDHRGRLYQLDTRSRKRVRVTEPHQKPTPKSKAPGKPNGAPPPKPRRRAWR